MLKEHSPKEVQINTLFEITEASQSVRDVANEIIKDKNVYHTDSAGVYEEYEDDEEWDEDYDEDEDYDGWDH